MFIHNPHRVQIALIIAMYIFFQNASAIAVSGTSQLTYGSDISSRSPAWSPDGLRIAYSAGSGYSYSIYIMNDDGSSPVKLTGTKAGESWVDREPAWSPDGTKIVFQRRTYRGEQYEGDFIYIMNSDGSGQKKLISGGFDPVISPDGGYIAFDASAVDSTGSAVGFAIYIMKLDGTGVKKLTGSAGSDIMPSWSPDSKKIAFTRNGFIYVMDADGSNILSTGQEGYHPRWSLDGKHLVFISDTGSDISSGSGQKYTFIMNTDGTNVNRLTYGENRRDGVIDLSPDGTRMVIESAATTPAAPNNVRNIYMMKLDFAAAAPESPPGGKVAESIPRAPGFPVMAAIVSLMVVLRLLKK